MFIAICCFFGLLVYATAQYITQCQCSLFEPCLQRYADAMSPCIDSCATKQHLGEFHAVKHCMQMKQSIFQATIDCFRARHPDMCASGIPKQVPKFDVEMFKHAAIDEILALVHKAGSLQEVTPLISVAKKMSVCVDKCMQKATNHCFNAMNCGLNLAKNEGFNSARECAERTGVMKAELQGVCHCAHNSGMNSLAGVCAKIPV